MDIVTTVTVLLGLICVSLCGVVLYGFWLVKTTDHGDEEKDRWG